MTGPSILGLLLRRKRALLLSGVATACFGFAVSKVLPRSYLSEGSLIVENRTTANDGPSSPTALSNVLTQVDVLQTKGLTQRIVHDLDLVHVDSLQPTSKLPAVVTKALAIAWDYAQEVRQMLSDGPLPKTDEIEKTVIYVQKHLVAVAAENSSVITVRFEAGSPDTAAMVANAVMGTYLTTIGEGRESQIARTNAWIEEQIGIRKAEVTEAEHRVTDYVRSHSLPEVQQSPTTSIQLSKDQELLVKAKDDLAKKQAAFDTLTRDTTKQAGETLGSKTIQNLKDLEGKLIEQIALLTSIDPRRGPLNDALGGVRKQIVTETGLIYNSLARDVQVAQRNVDVLEKQIREEQAHADESTLNTAEYKQLTSDLDAKRQLFVNFLTQAGQARVAGEQQPTAHVLFQAQPPEKPLRNFGVLALIIGFIGGVVGSAGIVSLRSIVSPKVNSSTDVAMLIGMPVFGSLTDVKRGQSLLAAPKTTSMVTETFRAMWITLRPSENEGTAVLVTSSETGEGKTTVAAAMARRFSEDGYRVLVIDADLRHPSLAQALDVPKPEPKIGATDSFDQGIVHISDNLDCLLLGRIENPVKVLSSARFAQLLSHSRRTYDFVILDSPPVLHVADPLLLAGLCQHIIFIVQAGRLQTSIVNEAIRRFSETDREKIQTLLTRVRRGELDRRDYYSGYVKAA